MFEREAFKRARREQRGGVSVVVKKALSRSEFMVSHAENMFLSREAEMLKKARESGINVPRILEEKEGELVLEDLSEGDDKNVTPPQRLHELGDEKLRKVGEGIAKLHAAGIDAFDTDPLVKKDEVYFVDFGLAREYDPSDKVKLHVTFGMLRKKLHKEHAERVITQIMDGYAAKSGISKEKAASVLKEIRDPDFSFILQHYISLIDEL